MSGLRETMKSGWHPKGKDGKSSESWRGDFKGINQVAGWIGKGKDTSHRDAAHEHVSRPLSTLKDPSSFGPPPKNINYHGGAALPNKITPDRSGLGAPLTQAEVQATQEKEEEEREREAEEERRKAAPPVPFRIDTTGLSTANLPPPLGKKDGADARTPPAATKPKPGLPPRLPPRQDSTSSQTPASPPPKYSTTAAEPPAHKGILNQGSLNRLGAAGVSVPGFGIGGKQPLSLPTRTTPTRQTEPETTSPLASNGGPQLSGLQSRFSRMSTSSSNSEVPSQGTTFAQKQAALRTASAFRNDPSSVSLSDARNAASTANNFRQRHGDQVASGWKSANSLNQKYGLADKVGKYTNPASSGPVANLDPAASPTIEMRDNTSERHGDQVASGWKAANSLNQKYGLADKVGKYTNPGSNGRVPTLGLAASPVASPASNGPIATLGPAASPTIETRDNIITAKKAPPPPPKKKPELAGAPTAGAGPPPVPLASKPKLNITSPSIPQHDLDLDLKSLWFAKQPVVFPPPSINRLPGSRTPRYTMGWSSSGARKTWFLTGAIRDETTLATTKIHLTWDGSEPGLTVKAEQRHKPPPKPLSRRELDDYRDKYGERIASWCEARIGQKVGNGECWTLANNALEAVAEECRARKQEACVPSRSYIHGTLIYTYIPPKPSDPPGGVEAAGVARGDIIQFLTAHMRSRDGMSNSYRGAPDHTAVITAVERGGVLRVLEQNVGSTKIVIEGKVDMAEMVSGEKLGRTTIKEDQYGTTAVPKPLTTAEVLEKFAGPKVDIYVGPENKHYHLPKDIICYYSPYFDRCFNGGFKEAKEQKLVLPEDRVEYFQHLLDYMFLNGGNPIKAEGNPKQQLQYYIDFIEYAGKYNLLGAFKMISGELKNLLESSFRGSWVDTPLQPKHIETVFRVLPEGHELRGLIALIALKFGLIQGFYAVQEKTVEGFAAEMLNQLRKHKNGRNFAHVSSYYAQLDHTF